MGGPQWGNCPVCGEWKPGEYQHYSPFRAVYARVKGKGFVRIGWHYQKCGHVHVDKPLQPVSAEAAG